MKKQQICILGSTGSIGTQALDVIAFRGCHLEEEIEGRIIYTVECSNQLSTYGIHQVETDDFCPSHVLSVAIRKMTREKDLATRIVACLLLGVDVLKLHEHILIVLEAILLQIERYEDAIDVEHQILSIHSVENIIGDGESNLALHTMRFAQLTYLIYFVSSYHTLL